MVAGFILAICGQATCGVSPADDADRSQFSSLMTTDPVGAHACGEAFQGNATNTSWSPE